MIGRVEPSRDDDAIRLSLDPPAGPPVRSGTLERVDRRAGRSALSRETDDSLQLQGTYRAMPPASRSDAMGVEISNREPCFVSYQAAFSPGVDERRSAGAIAALSSEIDYIENLVCGTWRAPQRR